MNLNVTINMLSIFAGLSCFFSYSSQTISPYVPTAEQTLSLIHFHNKDLRHARTHLRNELNQSRWKNFKGHARIAATVIPASFVLASPFSLVMLGLAKKINFVAQGVASSSYPYLATAGLLAITYTLMPKEQVYR